MNGLDSSAHEAGVRFRVLLTAVLVVYLVAIVITGYVQLSPALDVPFALVGWLLFGGLIVWAGIRRRKYSADDFIDSLFNPISLTTVFLLLLFITSYFALGWQVPAECHGLSLSCLKGYEWRTNDGLFYHVTPDGLSAQITRAGYIQEVGVHLRSAAAFGVYSLCFAWAATSALRHR